MQQFLSESTVTEQSTSGSGARAETKSISVNKRNGLFGQSVLLTAEVTKRASPQMKTDMKVEKGPSFGRASTSDSITSRKLTRYESLTTQPKQTKGFTMNELEMAETRGMLPSFLVITVLN